MTEEGGFASSLVGVDGKILKYNDVEPFTKLKIQQNACYYLGNRNSKLQKNEST